MAVSRTLFDPVLVTDLMNKVKRKIFSCKTFRTVSDPV